MYKLVVTSSSVESLILNQQGKNYIITSIDGLGPVNANINVSTLGLSNGAIFNSSKIGSRNIVINLRIINKAEQTRRELYKIFTPGEKVDLCYISNKNYYISGYIETVDCDLFTNKQKMQISILCPYPYFKDNSMNLANSYGSITIHNPGVEIGCQITINETNPTITNETTGQIMRLTSNGKVTIDSRHGMKSVKQDGTEIFPFTEQNDWITLKPGDNTITTNGSISISFFPEYAGV